MVAFRYPEANLFITKNWNQRKLGKFQRETYTSPVVNLMVYCIASWWQSYKLILSTEIEVFNAYNWIIIPIRMYKIKTWPPEYWQGYGGTGCPRSGLQVSRLGRYTPFNLSSQSLQGCVVPRVWLDSDPKAESGPQGWLRDHSPATWKELCQAEPAQRERKLEEEALRSLIPFGMSWVTFSERLLPTAEGGLWVGAGLGFLSMALFQEEHSGILIVQSGVPGLRLLLFLFPRKIHNHIT